MRTADCHPSRQYYCKGLCKPCYNGADKRREREKKRGPLVAMSHPEKPYASRGLCFDCFASFRSSPEYTPARKKARGNCVNHPDRSAEARNLCKSCYTTWRRADNPERSALERRRDRAAVYGISLAEFDRLKAVPNCEICSKILLTPSDRHIDHCHKTNHIRGVLCFTCNKALGMFGDDEAGMNNVMAYLRRPFPVFSDKGGQIQQRMAVIGIYVPDPEL